MGKDGKIAETKNKTDRTKKKSKKVKQRKSDPAVNGISQLFSTSLCIISPDSSRNSRGSSSSLAGTPKNVETDGAVTIKDESKNTDGSEAKYKTDIQSTACTSFSINDDSYVVSASTSSKCDSKLRESDYRFPNNHQEPDLENLITNAIAESNQELKRDNELSLENHATTEQEHILNSSKIPRKRGRPRKNKLVVTDDTTVNKQKKTLKSKSKTVLPHSPNSSSSSLDSFVIRYDKDKNVESGNKNEEKICESHSESVVSKSHNSDDVASNSKNITSYPRNEQSDDSDGTETQQIRKNAFEFMMESRHISIGMNLQGKKLKIENDKSDKSKPAARKQLLQKWADSKGGIKRKIEEEEREEFISCQMDKRAKRLKKLARIPDNSENKKETRKRKRFVIKTDSESSRDSIDINIKIEIKSPQKSKKLHKNFNLSQNNMNSFLQKKNQNDKEKSDESIEVFVTDDEDRKSGESSLKVKLFSPHLFKNKTEKTILGTDNDSNSTDKSNVKKLKKESKSRKKHLRENESILIENIRSSNSTNHEKLRKTEESNQTRLQFTSEEDTDHSLDSNILKGLRRSKRTIKRTSRYADMCTISEDDESNDSIVIDLEKYDERAKKKVKAMAPVFLNSLPKPKLDPAAFEARRKFLNSGIPDSLRRFMEKEQSNDYQYEIFPSISHIQQKHTYPSSSIDYWNLPDANLNLLPETTSPIPKHIEFTSIINRNERKRPPLKPAPRIRDFKRLLQEIKDNNPGYPVFRCFRLLNKKSNALSTSTVEKSQETKYTEKNDLCEGVVEDDSESDMWTEKYKAMCFEDIMGNNKPVTKLRIWLKNWLQLCGMAKPSRRKRRYSSGSEFEGVEDCRDDDGNPCNAMILHGPHGCGKTMSVYGICNELGINVIELNASTKRTGKRLLQELQEATQSHQVKKNNASSVTNFFSSKIDNRKKDDEKNSKNKMCLLLIEDIDLVFDQDDGFLSALGQLLTTTKRPFVLTTSDISCSYLQKFTALYPIVNFSPLSAKVMSIWLQILCLLEGVKMDCKDLGELLEHNKGDVRRTILQLQVLVQSGGSVYGISEKCEEINDLRNRFENAKDDDELNPFNVSESNESDIKTHKNSIYNFLDKECLVNDLSLENIWWNIPKIKSRNKNSEEHGSKSDSLYVETTKCGNKIDKIERNNIICDKVVNNKASIDKVQKEIIKNDLKKISDLCDTLGTIDVVYAKSKIVEKCDNFSMKMPYLKDSLELKERFDYLTNEEFIKDWTNVLLENSLPTYNDVGTFNLDVPSSGQRRWLKKQKECSDKFSELVPLTCQVDGKSFALDYFPTLRDISRSEVQRARVNVKRKNRFFSYFRNLEFDCGESRNETACNIFVAKEEG